MTTYHLHGVIGGRVIAELDERRAARIAERQLRQTEEGARHLARARRLRERIDAVLSADTQRELGGISIDPAGDGTIAAATYAGMLLEFREISMPGRLGVSITSAIVELGGNIGGESDLAHLLANAVERYEQERAALSEHGAAVRELKIAVNAGTAAAAAWAWPAGAVLPLYSWRWGAHPELAGCGWSHAGTLDARGYVLMWSNGELVELNLAHAAPSSRRVICRSVADLPAALVEPIRVTVAGVAIVRWDGGPGVPWKIRSGAVDDAPAYAAPHVLLALGDPARVDPLVVQVAERPIAYVREPLDEMRDELDERAAA